MADAPRQRVERIPGARRARLTPVDGTDPAPEVPIGREADAAASAPSGEKGPNDERLRQDVPPHY